MRFLPYNPEQAYRLPPSVKDVLGEDPLCFFIYRLVDKLDLRGLEADYQEEWRAAYAQAMMVKLWLYAYALGVMSSRWLERVDTSHGQRRPDRGIFACPMPHRQPHVVNRDGARRYRCLIQAKLLELDHRQSSGRFTSPFRTGFNYSNRLCLRNHERNSRPQPLGRRPNGIVTPCEVSAERHVT